MMSPRVIKRAADRMRAFRGPWMTHACVQEACSVADAMRSCVQEAEAEVDQEPPTGDNLDVRIVCPHAPGIYGTAPEPPSRDELLRRARLASAAAFRDGARAPDDLLAAGLEAIEALIWSEGDLQFFVQQGERDLRSFGLLADA